MADVFERLMLLKRTPVFSAVSTDDLRLLTQELTEEDFEAGERVFDIHDPSDRLYLIISGRIGISLFTDPSRREYLAELGPHECFGEMGLFDNKPRSATAHVIEDAQLLALDKGKLLGIIQHHPELALGVIRSLNQRLRQANVRET